MIDIQDILDNKLEGFTGEQLAKVLAEQPQLAGEFLKAGKPIQIWVQGELTVKNSKSEMTITKTQFGRAEVKYLKTDPTIPVDIGNDYKAAATDCLKKCAAEFGIASDVYGKAEFKELGVEVVDDELPIRKSEVIVSRPVVVEKKEDPNIKVGFSADYAEKLKAQIIKMNNGKAMTERQMLDFLNDKLKMKLTKITSGASAQMLLAQLITKK